MRRARLHEFVADLIEAAWTGDDADVAAAVLADQDAYGALCHHLNDAGGGDATGIEQAWLALVASLSDHALDWLADTAEHPAAVLASMLAGG
jgi:hypothetical protein